jgi:hypothetical protein
VSHISRRRTTQVDSHCRIALYQIKAARKRPAPVALGLLAAQAPASAGAPAG